MIGSESYEDDNGKFKIEVLLENENVWLNINSIALLFDVQRPAIVKHINNIYADEELEETRKVNSKIFLITGSDSKKYIIN